MPIIKLNATDSTNSYLKELSNEMTIEDFTVVVARSQNKGRGQMGSVWQSESDKNLTCSVFKYTESLEIADSFYISMVVSIALIKTLAHFQIPRLAIKWPNDILSEQKKIGGILIENVIKNNGLLASIIGVGLNVNQLSFDNLPRATSMKILTAKSYDLDEVLHRLILNLEHYFSLLNNEKKDQIKKHYLRLLFRKEKPSTFKDRQGNIFTGIIKGISPSGQLKIMLEDDELKAFNFKEIELLY